MGRIVNIIFLSLMIASCSQTKSPKLSDVPVATTIQVLGSQLSTDKTVDSQSFEKMVELGDTAHVKLQGIITEVCQSKGCWMKVDLGEGEVMRVTFKDYGFFVPKDAAGKSVLIEGEGYKKVTTVEQLRHFAEDAGKSEEDIKALVEAREELAFVAQGVGILL